LIETILAVTIRPKVTLDSKNYQREAVDEKFVEEE